MRKRSTFYKAYMIRVTGIDHINFYVSDLDRSIEFYKKVFGFSVLEDHTKDEKEPWAIMGAGGKAFLAMYQKDDFRPPEQGPVNHWGFVIEDADRTLKALKENQVKILYADEPHGGIIDWPKSKSIYIQDPDGYEIELSNLTGGGLG